MIKHNFEIFFWHLHNFKDLQRCLCFTYLQLKHYGYLRCECFNSVSTFLTGEISLQSPPWSCTVQATCHEGLRMQKAFVVIFSVEKSWSRLNKENGNSNLQTELIKIICSLDLQKPNHLVMGRNMLLSCHYSNPHGASPGGSAQASQCSPGLHPAGGLPSMYLCQ